MTQLGASITVYRYNSSKLENKPFTPFSSPPHNFYTAGVIPQTSLIEKSEKP
jgi:hypothetical protein